MRTGIGRRVAAGCAGLFVSAATVAAVAAATIAVGPASARPRVSPVVAYLRAVAAHPPRAMAKGVVTAEGFTGSLRFDHVLSADDVRVLQRWGVRLAHARGAGPADRIGTVYPAFVPFAALDRLGARADLVQVDALPPVKPLAPLDVTRARIGVPELTSWLSRNAGMGAGEGITIADIDSGIDPYHPALFDGDGGYYAWLDVDGNGKPTWGVDAVDLDGNGRADPGETMRRVDTPRINLYAGDHTWDELYGDGTFEANLDFVYADTDGNQQRDPGTPSAATEATPAFGEPIFVVDDVDGDGALDVGEKLIRLKTSKIDKVMVGMTEYRRGENLSSLTSSFFGTDADGLPTCLHGTGVAGILVAGVPGASRYLGMAPAARLLMVDYSHNPADWTEASDIERLAWARDQGADIVLHEYAGWGFTPMDGTSNFEAAMDGLYQDDGVLQVVPAGNLAESGKHMQTDLPVGDTTVNVALPAYYPDYGPSYPFQTPGIFLTLYFRGAADGVAVAVAVPGGSAVTLPLDGSGVSVGTSLWAGGSTTPSSGGIVQVLLWVMDGSQVAVPSGTYAFTLHNGTGATLPIHGFLNDYSSGWSRVITFDRFESADSTICNPSTAGSAISVAAYGGEFGTADALGWLRGYSSRGPRIDGPIAIDIAAPDDPYTPLPEADLSDLGGPVLRYAYSVFGGTSGAGPHVAGALALLKQAVPGEGAPALWARLTGSADTDPRMGALPNKDYGYGRLDVYRAARGVAAPVDAAPVARAAADVTGAPDVRLDASGSTDADGDALEFRWDFDYDGTWDTPWAAAADATWTCPGDGLYTAKVAARDPAGREGAALVTFRIGAVPPEPVPDAAGPDAAADVAEDVAGPDAGVDAGTEVPAADGVADVPGTDAGADGATPDGTTGDAAGTDAWTGDPGRPGDATPADRGSRDPGADDGAIVTLPAHHAKGGCSAAPGGSAVPVAPVLLVLGLAGLAGGRRRRGA